MCMHVYVCVGLGGLVNYPFVCPGRVCACVRFVGGWDEFYVCMCVVGVCVWFGGTNCVYLCVGGV